MPKIRTKSASDLQVKKQKEKSSVVTVDINNLKERLTRLKNAGHKRTADLNEKEKDDYEFIVQVVGLLYGQPGYAVIVAEIRTVFANVIPQEIGTVNAYIVGCLISSEVLGGCNPLCASSVPFGDVVQCDVQVIWANRVGNTYQFTRLSQGTDQTKARVFFPSHIKSLTDSEKTDLKNMGCDSVLFYSSNTVENKYSQTFDDYVTIDSIPSDNNKKDNSWIWFIALIFVIFLLILFVKLQQRK